MTATRMKAAYLTANGGPEVLRYGEVDRPEPGGGEVRIRMRAVALNHLDLFVRNGLPGIAQTFPHVVCADGAGEIDAVGSGVDGGRIGEKVVVQPGLFCGRCESCRAGEQSLCAKFRLLGEHAPGTAGEWAVVPEANVHPKPERLSWAEAAAFPLAYLTAWRMLVGRARLRVGEEVLIHGIGGGVALAALQIAKLAGARAFVTSSSPAKLERARELGADALIDYRATDVEKEIRRLTGKRGVDVVVDSVGEATWMTSLRSVAKGGRIVTCGATSGPNPAEEIRLVFWKQISILGSTMSSVAEFERLLRAVAAGELRPVVDRIFPLAEAPEAFARLEKGEQVGKIVLAIREE
jgi:NADPH:quinone reductase-like Zn-dependent oxidoreductase